MSNDVYAKALRHKVLNAAAERELLTQYADTRAKHGAQHKKTIAVRNKIVQSFLRLVAKYALRFRGLPFEDLMGEGVGGLVIAIERFEVERGLRFSTYAQYWIRHEQRRAVENLGSAVRIPVCEQAKRRHGEARREGIDIGGAPLSLDAPLSEDGKTFLDVMSDPDAETAESELGSQQVSESVRRVVLATLTPREREIIESRYLRSDTETLNEVGIRLDGISRERVRQIEAEAFGKMRRALERSRGERGAV